MGRFCDSIITSIPAGVADSPAKFLDHLDSLVNLPCSLYHYARCVCYGSSKVYEALPRLLTVWFTHSMTIESMRNYVKSEPNPSVSVSRLEAIIRSWDKSVSLRVVQDIPVYCWMTVLPQLVSRVCHPLEAVVQPLNEILVKVLLFFP